MTQYRAGIDFGGTKIEIAVLDRDGAVVLRHREPNPGTYDGAMRVIASLVNAAEAKLAARMTVGVGIPGAIMPSTGLVKNANSTYLNGHPLDRELSALLEREVRVENDANCFALSEATDGAATGKRVVFGVILGTGCGGGIVVDGKVIGGLHSIAGEWGHNPLPWPRIDEFPMPRCFCGNVGCLERFVSGPALAEDCDGPGHRDASGIPARAAAGEERAIAALERHADRLARGLAQIINFLDPDAIVLGGGLSNMAHLYERVPALLPRNVITDPVMTPILRNRHGDSSGVRGAAWLWPALAR
ncbi:MAG TPA: ROK family protein [Acetobacteraceae bacterium]|nr:ROK family protein [Acetobacteraceae bacterium]